MDLKKMTLGQRIVAMARVCSAEHIRQEIQTAPADRAEIDAIARAVPPSPFSKQQIPTERFISIPVMPEVA